MKIAIQGTRNFKDYQMFLRGMFTALRQIEDNDRDITIFSAGPHNIKNMAQEFIGVSSEPRKRLGVSAKIVNVPPKWIMEHIHEIDHLAVFLLPKETALPIIGFADAKGLDPMVYRF